MKQHRMASKSGWLALALALAYMPLVAAGPQDDELRLEGELDRLTAQAHDTGKGGEGEQLAFIYRPPDLGAPSRRVGGGTRSISQLRALAPGHVGLTTRRQPRLYWYQAPGFRNPVRFRLSAGDAPSILFEKLLPADPGGGIRYLDLARHGVELTPGVVYEWEIRIEPLPHQRRMELVSSGRVKAIDDGRRLERLPPRIRPYRAAELGIWYDALDGISRLVDGDPHLREQRARLLDQGGLPVTAAYEREMIRLSQN